MGYRIMGRLHAGLFGLRERLAEQAGQGTVEYVGLILLIAGVMAAVVASGKGGAGKIGQTIVKHLQEAIDGAGRK